MVAAEILMAVMKPDYRYIARVTRVVDGDRFEAVVDLGFHIHHKVDFRLANIDAPTTDGVPCNTEEYRAGMVLKQWLKARIEGREVFLTTSRTGKFRWTAVVYLDGLEINFELIELDLAEAD